MPFVPPERFSNRQWSMGVRGPRREKASPGKSSPARFLKDAWVLAWRGRGSSASPGRRNSTCQGPKERKGDRELPINGGQDVSTRGRRAGRGKAGCSGHAERRDSALESKGFGAWSAVSDRLWEGSLPGPCVCVGGGPVGGQGGGSGAGRKLTAMPARDGERSSRDLSLDD